MKRKLDASLEEHLTKLMFKAISESEELREYLNQMQEEGALSNKSLLTFCLRPMSLINSDESLDSVQTPHATAGIPQELHETASSNFNEDEWLRENRLKNPFLL